MCLASTAAPHINIVQEKENIFKKIFGTDSIRYSVQSSLGPGETLSLQCPGPGSRLVIAASTFTKKERSLAFCGPRWAAHGAKVLTKGTLYLLQVLGVGALGRLLP